MARPCKLTKARTDDICEALKQGCSRPQAALYVGISPETLRTWYVKGSKVCDCEQLHGADGLGQDEVDARDFFHAVEHAEAIAAEARIKIISDAAETNWRAALSWLRHRYPDDWNPNRRPTTS